MTTDTISLSVNLSVVVAIASIFVCLSLLLLIADNWKNNWKTGPQTRSEPVIELALAHLAFIFGTGVLAVADQLDLRLVAVLVISGAIAGLICGYLSVLSLLRLRGRWRLWLPVWLGLSGLQCVIAAGTNEMPIIVGSSTAINGTLCLYFARKVWVLASRQGFDGRGLLALPFLALGAAYAGRLGLLLSGAPIEMMVMSSAVIAYVLAASSFMWVFARMSVRAWRLNRSLIWAARHDPLTGLENRRALSEASETWPARGWKPSARRMVCACIDLDYFKDINDSFGHAAGDTVLSAVAGRLKLIGSGPNDRVFRIGGDEFVMLQDIDRDVPIADHMDHVLRALGMEVRLGAELIRTSVSIGYFDTLVALPVDEMIRNADAALYRSKDRGRGCVSGPEELVVRTPAERPGLRLVSSKAS